jgi:hypothetical protein
MQQDLEKLHMHSHKLFIFVSSKLGISQFVLIN